MLKAVKALVEAFALMLLVESENEECPLRLSMVVERIN
jgi:hypothetical protein